MSGAWFRIWNESTKVMSYLDFKVVGGFVKLVMSPEPAQGEHTFMMWTGLFDKTGCKVYELDVVKTEELTDPVIVSVSESCGCCRTIVGFEKDSIKKGFVIGN